MPHRAGARGDSPRAPLRVLGWPAFANRAEQPYNALLYAHVQQLGVGVAEASAARVLFGQYDVLHLHWPDRRVRDPRALAALARSSGLIALLDVAHARGMKNIWTVHNLQAHEGRERRWLERRYWEALTRRLHGFISLSESGIAAARERFPRLAAVPAFVVPLPHLRGVYPNSTSRRAARRVLAIPADAAVITCVGQIRAYKNVRRLLQVFHAFDDDRAVLLIAGKTKPASLANELHAMAAEDARVRFVPAFIADAELQLYLNAADVVVLPYREILNSGTALLALSFDRPLLVPRRGAMADLARSVGSDWVQTYDGELTTEVLRAALAWATTTPRAVRAPLEERSWDNIARQTVEVYRALLQ